MDTAPDVRQPGTVDAVEPARGGQRAAVVCGLVLLATPVLLFLLFHRVADLDRVVDVVERGRVVRRTHEHPLLFIWAALAGAVPAVVTILACRYRARWAVLIAIACLTIGSIAELFVSVDPRIPAW